VVLALLPALQFASPHHANASKLANASAVALAWPTRVLASAGKAEDLSAGGRQSPRRFTASCCCGPAGATLLPAWKGSSTGNPAGQEEEEVGREEGFLVCLPLVIRLPAKSEPLRISSSISGTKAIGLTARQ
jgi:hypothetical protein